MAELTWKTKKVSYPAHASLAVDSIVYPQGRGYPGATPVNQLILGDNLAAMSALLQTYAGQVDLIYTDPPFFTNRSYAARIGRGEDSRRPGEWQLAEGYPDHWPDVDAYLDMLYPRLVLMHLLLAPHGTLYLHLDWHANSYARLLLDEIFGAEKMLNEIIWVYHGPSPIRSAFNRKHDTILAYTKSSGYTFNVDAVRQPYDKNTVKTFASSPKAGFGKVPNLQRGKVPEDWWYFPVVARLHSERTGYPTQKPEALLERIILASSNPGDLVADFFTGSGTTAVVAERLGRRFIANDVSPRSVHTARVRLAVAASGPFSIQSITGEESANQSRGTSAETISIDPSQILLTKVGDDLLLTLNSTLASQLDYWEIDPDWDGHVFRSAVQNPRPRQKKSPANTAQVAHVPGDNPVSIRLVSVGGENVQLLLNKPGS